MVNPWGFLLDGDLNTSPTGLVRAYPPHCDTESDNSECESDSEHDVCQERNDEDGYETKVIADLIRKSYKPPLKCGLDPETSPLERGSHHQL